MGRVVVAWRIRQYAWKVQRCTRVVGQILLQAFANPLPPSVTTRAGGRDPAHEHTPGPRILTPGRVPTQHAIGSLSDENYGASAQMDTIDEDDVMNLIDDRTERP